MRRETPMTLKDKLTTLLVIAPCLCYFAFLAGHNEHNRVLAKVHNQQVSIALPSHLPARGE